MKVYHELEPVYDESSEILILGSIPSMKSREVGFYYMHPTNRFWKTLEGVYQEPITDKVSFLKKHHIALWDVCASCEIDASKDASIKEVKVNDISWLLKKTKIKRIYTTGKKASELYQKYIYPKMKIQDINLPSTSSANAKLKLEDLIDQYQKLLK